LSFYECLPIRVERLRNPEIDEVVDPAGDNVAIADLIQ
jgi:hypothetical protein